MCEQVLFVIAKMGNLPHLVVFLVSLLWLESSVMSLVTRTLPPTILGPKPLVTRSKGSRVVIKAQVTGESTCPV